MNTLTLSQNYLLRKTSPIYMLDALKGPLPFIVSGGPDRYLSYPIPSYLKSISWGRKLGIHPSGAFSLGQYNVTTNGTKLIYGELGIPYTQFAKNQNHLKESDIDLIRRLLSIPDDCEFPEALYRHQIEIFFDKIVKLKTFLQSNGLTIVWKADTNHLRHIEICVDFLMPLERKVLIEHLDEVISNVCGEPFRSGEYRHRRFHRKEQPHHYWDLQLNTAPFKKCQAGFKLYDKGTLGRLEMTCQNTTLDEMPEGECPIEWFKKQVIKIAEAMALRLDSVIRDLMYREKRINDIDRTILINGIEKYSRVLKFRDDRVKTLVESLISRATYTPSSHKGNALSWPVINNLTKGCSSICESVYSKDYKRVRSIVLRADWKEKLKS